MGGGEISYSLVTHNDATGATVAVADAHCPLGRYFSPPIVVGTNSTVKVKAEDLRNQQLLTCDHHKLQWEPDLPVGGCLTRELFHESESESGTYHSVNPWSQTADGASALKDCHQSEA